MTAGDLTSENTLTYVCNDDEDEDVAGLDTTDYLYWNYWMQGGSSDSDSKTRAACTTDADCTTSGDACALITLDTLESKFCAPMDGWCALEDKDTDDVATGTFSLGSGWTIPNSLNKFTVDCSESEEYVTWFW